MRAPVWLSLPLLLCLACADDDADPTGSGGNGGATSGSGGGGGPTTATTSGGAGGGGGMPFGPVAHCGTTDPITLLELRQGLDDPHVSFEARREGNRLLLWGPDLGGLWSVGPCGEEPLLLAPDTAEPLPSTETTPPGKVLACVPGESPADEHLVLVELDTSGIEPARTVLDGCVDPTPTPAGWLVRHQIVPEPVPITNVDDPGRLVLLTDPHDPSEAPVELAPDVVFFGVVADAWVAAVRSDLTLWVHDLALNDPAREIAPGVVRLLPSTTLPRLAMQIFDGNPFGPILVLDVETEEATIVTYAYSPLAPPYEEWRASADGRAFVMVDEFADIYEAFGFDPIVPLTPPSNAKVASSFGIDIALPDGSFWYTTFDSDETRTVLTWRPLEGTITELMKIPNAGGITPRRADPWMFAVAPTDPYVAEGALYLTSQQGPLVTTPSVERIGYLPVFGPEGVALHVLDVDPTTLLGTLQATRISTDDSFVVKAHVPRHGGLVRVDHLGVFATRPDLGPDGGPAAVQVIAVPGAAPGAER